MRPFCIFYIYGLWSVKVKVEFWLQRGLKKGSVSAISTQISTLALYCTSLHRKTYPCCVELLGLVDNIGLFWALNYWITVLDYFRLSYYIALDCLDWLLDLLLNIGLLDCLRIVLGIHYHYMCGCAEFIV